MTRYIVSDILRVMNTADLLKQMREDAGLSQEAVARGAGTSQPTLAAYEAGRAEPRLSTLERLAVAAGFDLSLEARPMVRRGAVAITEAAVESFRLLRDEGQSASWRRLLDFVDDFRGSSIPGKRSLVEHQPKLCGDRRMDAAVAALVEFLCTEAGLASPAWTDEAERFAEPWWFVAGLPGFEAMALRDSPIAFARHGVFVNEGAFDRV